ncbi:MAG TPA: hypothetical protein VMR33_08315 [Candidatus Baltobacteraceae bacterium]|jgi:hypothetical protein|nr:hypothetical protein [Candidatus Baltobacteraceae bacterium]
MIKRFALLLALAGIYVQGRAAVLPPEKLLPQDTVLVVTAPDWPMAWSFLTNTSYGRLLQDPALRPFRNKFIDNFTTDTLNPLQQSLGIKFSDYRDLLQGEVAFALLPVGPKENSERHFSQLLLIDTKGHASQLKTNLASITKRWIDAGKAIKTQKIREVEFTTLIVSPGDLSWSKIFPKMNPVAADDGDSKPREKNTEITFGQIDSLLIAGDSPDVIEKVLTLQQGGLLAPLSDEPSFQSDFQARLQGAPYYCWINVKALMGALTAAPAESDDEAAASVLKLTSLLNATGLAGVTSACISFQESPDGTAAQLFIGAPESKRAGVLKVLTPEAKDSNPPPFVPADAVKFWRWRVNIPHSWALLESMMSDLNPQFNRVLDFILQNAGKDKDEHYDLKSELLSNLGDDVINYEKAPGASSFADLKSPPSIYLIGSPNPGKLTSALTVALGIMSQGTGGVKQREFLGRTIHSVTLGASDNPAAPTLSFSGSGGYVAIASDAGILEEYLRSNDSKAKTLMETDGLGAAAQNVGGLSTGWFGFENQNQDMRPMFDLLRNQRPTVTDILGTPAIAGSMTVAEQITSKLLDWSDFTLLPQFGAVSKYFYYSVYAGRFSPEGFTLKVYAPTPPALR